MTNLYKKDEIFDFTEGVQEKIDLLEERFVFDNDDGYGQDIREFFTKYVWWPDMLLAFHEYYSKKPCIDKFILSVSADPELYGFYTVEIEIVLIQEYRALFRDANGKYLIHLHTKFEDDLLEEDGIGYMKFFNDSHNFNINGCAYITELVSVGC